MARDGILFLIGGGAYVVLELGFRGRSHWTMFVLGGLCFWLIGLLGRRGMRRRPRMLAGAVIITAGELLFGLVFNGNYAIWDYRQAPLNFRGQICLPFSLLWLLLSPVAAWIFDWLDEKLPGRK